MRHPVLFVLTMAFILLIANGIDTYLLPETIPLHVEFLLAVLSVGIALYVAEVVATTHGDEI